MVNPLLLRRQMRLTSRQTEDTFRPKKENDIKQAQPSHLASFRSQAGKSADLFRQTSVLLPTAQPAARSTNYRRCALPPSPGRCTRNITRWYYDTQSNQCRSFIYSGCAGNENNFLSSATCQLHCLR
jgi:hypothetical protein